MDVMFPALPLDKPNDMFVHDKIGEKMADRYRLETPAFCSKCGKSYYRKDALQRHMKECGRVPPLSCSMCPYRTFRKDNLMRHSMKHMKVSLTEQDPDAPQPLFPFTPQDLLHNQPQILESRVRLETEDLAAEEKVDEPETMLEERSDEELTAETSSQDHSPDQEKIIDRRRLDNPVGCDTCGKVYYWKGALRRHMKECGRDPPMICTFCTYRTFRKDNLLSHLFRKHNVLQN
ncbi:hypothetical protein J6590_014941 [Homalodisca vitripennis]|nr:hypothetical protein J6590_014941 [Homalodisca vitripennis]